MFQSKCTVPHLEILGAPIGDLIFCAKIVTQKCASALNLLNQLSEVVTDEPQVALLLLHHCIVVFANWCTYRDLLPLR